MMIYFFGPVRLVLEPTTDQIQEAISDAVNNIVKHFHKPEKEVRAYTNLIQCFCLLRTRTRVCVCVCVYMYMYMFSPSVPVREGV